ncbi:MAG: conjugal transfer protein TraG N-terminal domain-containing protein, partial [Gammaproteobacteria bacterium]|nr:conjugal transfer protein TraG N-terminal domain-containing protein [Gammaproteobacteria bacterium]
MPASIITSVEAGLTQGLSDVFHTPSDVSYATTGMLFGAQLFNAVNNGSVIFDDQTKNNFNHFVRQCIVPDILINHKYTYEQLANSPDILSFLSQEPMSPLRGIYINGQFDTCATALPIVSQEIESNVSNQTSFISNSLMGDQPITGGDLFSKIQNVYSYMMDMTTDASSILYQNTMINAVR